MCRACCAKQSGAFQIEGRCLWRVQGSQPPAGQPRTLRGGAAGQGAGPVALSTQSSVPCDSTDGFALLLTKQIVLHPDTRGSKSWSGTGCEQMKEQGLGGSMQPLWRY
eukprot:902012-Pelagomonas_calceolata.AAC.14